MISRYDFIGFSEPLASWSHFAGAIIFLCWGAKTLIKGRGNFLRVSSLGIYIFSGFFLFCMSGVYHLLDKGTSANYVLQILDYAGIYLLIAGTFTPMQIILLRKYKRWIPLLAIWILAITGLTLTSIFFDDMPEWLILIFFLCMGWMSLFTVWFIRRISPITVKKIALGGILYTAGAIFDFLKWPTIIEGVFEAHEIFHLFVLAAALVHFHAIFSLAATPISARLTLIIRRFPTAYKAFFTTEKSYFEGEIEDKVQAQAVQWVKDQYPKSLRPTSIRVKHHNEDSIDIS